jgi:radical SAM protein with 4Fe4S-binding SPASM domain
MDFESFKHYLSMIPKSTQIDFSGMSEIFQNQYAVDMIKYVDEQGYDMVFYTTLAGLSMKNFEQIKDILFKYQIILHLPDNDGFTKIQITEEYLEVLNALVFSKFGSDLPIVSNTYTTVHQKVIDSGIRMDVLNPISLINNDFLISRGNNLNNVKQVIKKEGNIICLNGGPDHNILLPNGDVLLCCMCYNLEDNIILGNLNEDSYENIMNSNKIKEIKRKMNTYDENIICRYCEKSKVKL